MATRRRKGRRAFGATRRLPSGRWQASYLGPDGVRRVAPQTFPEAADANAWLASAEASIAGGEWRPPELARESFGNYGRRWLAQRPDLRASTRELYGFLWRKWLEPAFGTVPIGALTTEAWRAWYLAQTVEHPGSTQPSKAYRLARAMLNTAVEDGLLRSNPCKVKGASAEHAPERPIAMPSDVAKLAMAVHPKYRAMVLLGAYCSLRFGELAGLRRSRIDLLHRTVTVEEAGVELSGGRVVFGPPKTAAGRRACQFRRSWYRWSRTTWPSMWDLSRKRSSSPTWTTSPLGATSSVPFGRPPVPAPASPGSTSTTCAAQGRPGRRPPAPRCER